MRLIKKGATSQSIHINIADNTSTNGGKKTGLVWNTSNLSAAYTREGGTSTVISLQTLAAANSAWASGGFKEIHSTQQPGDYRLDIPDAAIAAGSGDYVTVTVVGASGALQADLTIQLVAFDPQDSVRGGLTAMPNAAAGANGGLPLGDASGRVDLGKWLGTAVTLSSGVPDVNIKTITAGIIAAASFAANALDAVWSTATRVLTANTNLNDLNAAGIRSALGFASANADTQLSAINTNVSAVGTAVIAVPTANANADALLDRANAVETGLTLRQAQRLIAAAAAGKLSGAATTTNTIRNAVADSKNRIVATVDSDGNRTAITTDLT